jgi:hypothetical protein
VAYIISSGLWRPAGAIGCPGRRLEGGGFLVFVFTVKVAHRPVIAAAESFTVRIAVFARYVGMAETVVVFNVGSAVMVKVIAGGLNPIVITPSLHFLELLRRGVPVVITVLNGYRVGSVW